MNTCLLLVTILSPGATHGKWDKHGDLHFLRLQPTRGDLLVARRGQDLQHGVPGEGVMSSFIESLLQCITFLLCKDVAIKCVPLKALVYYIQEFKHFEEVFLSPP